MDIIKKLSSLQEISKIQLSKILSLAPDKKNLILESSLIKPLERVCGVKWLKGNGVEKIYKLESVNPEANTNAIFYMIHLDTKVFKRVVDQIRSQTNIENPVKDRYHIIVVPRHTCTFENELEQLGLLHSIVRVHSFQWMPVHLDTGLLSLELPDVYSSLFVYENLACLPALSKCLWQLSFVIGKPEFVLALGKYSNGVLKQFEEYCENRGDTDKLESDVGALIIVDRSMDYTSALLTPGNYAALLSEVYTVSTGICEKKKEETEKLDEKCNPLLEKQPLHITLDSTKDSIYSDIKNRYFTEVTSVLSNLTKQLKTEKVNSKEMALDEIKRYVQTQLQATKFKKKLITNHLMAAETIINILGHRYERQNEIEQNIVRNTDRSANLAYLEELLNTSNDPRVTLRLFCLFSLFQSPGDSDVRRFWSKFLHQFGFERGFAFHNLATAGFVPEPAPSGGALNLQGKLKLPMFAASDAHVSAKNLRQLPPDPSKVNLRFPTCPSYIFGGGYVPLIAQMAGMVLNSVPVAEIRGKIEALGSLFVTEKKGHLLQNRTVLIYVIGGVTYAEVAACNLLETLMGAQIVILSDKIITGNDLMESILSYPK